MRGKLTISISSILMVMIFIMQFISFSYFPWHDTMKYGIMVIITIFVMQRYKILLKKKYVVINGLAILFGLLTICASFINRNQVIERNSFLASIVFVASYLLFLFFIEIMVERKKIKKMLHIFFKTAFLISILTDLIMILMPNIRHAYGGNYLVGTKFDVVYLHLLVLTMYISKTNFNFKNKFKKKRLIILGIWSIVVAIHVQCSTGVVGVVLLFLLIYIIEKRAMLFLNCIVYTGLQLFCLSFVYINQFILNSSLAQVFVLNVLQRDITLTSRTRIFELVPKLLVGNTFWGFGYGTSYELGMKKGAFPNTQNAILEWIWQIGIPSTIVMLILFASFFYFARKNMNQRSKKIIIPIIAYIYMLTILGTVEITIEKLYFAVLIIVFAVASEKDESNLNFNMEIKNNDTDFKKIGKCNSSGL